MDKEAIAKLMADVMIMTIDTCENCEVTQAGEEAVREHCHTCGLRMASDDACIILANLCAAPSVRAAMEHWGALRDAVRDDG